MGGADRSSRTPTPNGRVRSREVSITGTRRNEVDVLRPPQRVAHAVQRQVGRLGAGLASRKSPDAPTGSCPIALGTYSVLRGNIMALVSITVTTGATVHGRMLARTGAITLESARSPAPPAAASRNHPCHEAVKTESTAAYAAPGATCQ